MKDVELMRLLKRNGWIKVRQKGSHAVFIKPDRRNIVVPLHPSRDIPSGTLSAILKQAGL